MKFDPANDSFTTVFKPKAGKLVIMFKILHLWESGTLAWRQPRLGADNGQNQ